MRAVMRAHDGRGEPTLLTSTLMQHFEARAVSDMVQRVYRERLSREEIVALSSLVVKSTKKGDRIGTLILKEAGEELGASVIVVIINLQMESEQFEVAMSGGVFEAGEFVVPHFTKRVGEVAPKVKFTKFRFEPAVRAILLGLKEMGVEIDDRVLRRIDNSYAKLSRAKGI